MKTRRYRVLIGKVPTLWETVLCDTHASRRDNIGEALTGKFDGLCHSCDDEYQAQMRDRYEAYCLSRAAPFED